MRAFKRVLCLFLAWALTLCLFGCGNGGNDRDIGTDDIASYIGTWKGSDHDGENVVHYLIFDEDGYWNVYMNYKSLVKAIRQLPEQLVSFKIFRQLQNSDQTGCHFEYVKNDGDSHYVDAFSISDGHLVAKDNEDVLFTLISDYTGEPDETMIAESGDLFDRARQEALLKK
ncbi:MAG: hypothetical protein IJA68_01455 [Clostridia bacterium]|nr:hypothetical protein [Clostridia bacterium]